MTALDNQSQAPPWFDRARDSVAARLGIGTEERIAIYADLSGSASLRDVTYWLEILFACGIATLGLILDSPAVIIGAMLISPLMGPILSGGLALASGDFILGIRSILIVGFSCALAVGFATTLVVLLPFREMTAEIAARTRPNTLDLAIALFSGAIGALAVCKKLKGVATSIPGVAIAVALMPPLSVVGYGAGVYLTLDRTLGSSVLRGGGLLFLTNLIAITCASMAVFLVLNIGSAEARETLRRTALEDSETRDFWRLLEHLHVPVAIQRIGSLPGRLVLALTFVAVITIPLTRTFDALKVEIGQKQRTNQIQRKATEVWQRFFATKADGNRSFVDTLTAAEKGSRLMVQLRVFTNEPYNSSERARFVDYLAQALERSSETIDLELIEIPTARYRAAPPAIPALPTVRALDSADMQELISRLAAKFDEGLRRLPLPSQVIAIRGEVRISGGSPALRLDYVAADQLSPDASEILSNEITRLLDLREIPVEFRYVPSHANLSFSGKPASGEDQRVTELYRELLAGDSTLGLILTPPVPQPRNFVAKTTTGTVAAELGVTPARVTAVGATPGSPKNKSLVITLSRTP